MDQFVIFRKTSLDIMDNKQTKKRKEAVLKALEEHLGVVTDACQACDVARSTFYLWTKEDPDFKKVVEEMEDSVLDFVESNLFKKIKLGDTTAIIFFLKTKGKKRGYIEKVVHDHSVEFLNGTMDIPLDGLDEDDLDHLMAIATKQINNGQRDN